jgi:hypothetical protein
MNTDLYKSIALSMESYKKLRELADHNFEMPLSLAKSCSYFITKAYEEYKANGKKSSR